MAGGEFRFGTDSIYMARHQHRPPESTSAKIWITWLHYGCVSGPIASLFNTIAVFRRGKLGLMTTVANVACPVDGSELEGERMMSLCARHIGYGTDLAPPQER